MQSNQQSAIRAVFIIPPKAHLLDITGPAQIFHEAAQNGAAVELIFGTIFTGETGSVSSSMLSFDKLTSYDQLQLNHGDLVFVPGIDSSLFSDKAFVDASRPFLYWLNTQHRNGIIICSICTGAFFLAESGLLDGRACTTHWEFI